MEVVECHMKATTSGPHAQTCCEKVAHNLPIICTAQEESLIMIPTSEKFEDCYSQSGHDFFFSFSEHHAQKCI